MPDQITWSLRLAVTDFNVRATDWPTAINIGLNELDLQVGPQEIVRYKVRYWRWATYVLGLCGVLG